MYAKGNSGCAEAVRALIEPGAAVLHLAVSLCHRYSSSAAHTRYALIAVSLQAPSQKQRQAALFKSTAVHASFGDVELAHLALHGMQALTPLGCFRSSML